MKFGIGNNMKKFKTITKNFNNDLNITLINKGITHSNSITKSNMMFGGEDRFDGIKFSNFIKDNNIDYINFLKTDCEGGEYHIFLDENMDFLLNNVSCIVGEWHLNTPEKKVYTMKIILKIVLKINQ